MDGQPDGQPGLCHKLLPPTLLSHTPNGKPMLFSCWATVYEVKPTLDKKSHQLMAGPLSRELCQSISRIINLYICGPNSRVRVPHSSGKAGCPTRWILYRPACNRGHPAASQLPGRFANSRLPCVVLAVSPYLNGWERTSPLIAVTCYITWRQALRRWGVCIHVYLR